MRKVALPPCAHEMHDHLAEAIIRLGASAHVTLDPPAKLTKNDRPVAVHVDTIGNEHSGGVFAWRTPERTEGELPRKLLVETIEGVLVDGWRTMADDWIRELVVLQRRDDDLVARGLDPRQPPASSLSVHRIVHDILEADGRGGLHDPRLIFQNGGYAMPGLVGSEHDDDTMPTRNQKNGGSASPLFVIDMIPMGGRLEARKVGTATFWFEQEDGQCRVVLSYATGTPPPLPDTVLGGLEGSDLADLFGHSSIKPGRYVIQRTEILPYSDHTRLSVSIDDQQVPLLAD